MMSEKILLLLLLAICISTSTQQNEEKEFKDCESACKQKPMDITFVVDASSSIWPNNFTQALWFVEDFVDIFNVDPEVVRVAVVSYGDRVYEEDAFGFDQYTDKLALKQAITKIPYRAGLATETGAGLQFMRKNFLPTARKGVKTVAIVLTDGNSQRPGVTAKQAKKAREAGAEIFAVGIGREVSEEELRAIAGVDSHVFVVTSYNLLGTIRSRLAFETCGEIAPPIKQVVCRDNPIDISLVIDASSSIGSMNFTVGLEFVKKFVGTFDISPQRARFSVITYGRGIYENTAFDFDAYTDEVSLVDAIGSIPYIAGDHTDTGLGIQFMTDQQMLPKQRPHAAHIAIVLTDGNSQDWEMTRDEAARARNAKIGVFAIGVGVYVSVDELQAIAGEDKYVFAVPDYNALETIRQELDDKACEIVLSQFHPYLKQ